MIFNIFYVLAFAFASDMILTYFYLKEYRVRFPKNDWTLSESNLIIRACIRKWGLGEGMVAGALIVGFIVLMIVIKIPNEWRYFLLGIYFMTNAFHFLNFQALKRLNEVKK